MQEQTIHIAADHPSLVGHFPGNPVVPGVVLMTQVVQALERCQGGPVQICAVPTVKFVAPLRPGQEVKVAFTPLRPGLVKFRCEVGATAIANGNIEIDPVARASSKTP